MSSKQVDNEFTKRLFEIGREDLLTRIANGEVKLYEAMIIAGLCEASPVERVGDLKNRWSKLSENEKRKFISINLAELSPLISDLQTEKGKKTEAAKDQKDMDTAFDSR